MGLVGFGVWAFGAVRVAGRVSWGCRFLGLWGFAGFGGFEGSGFRVQGLGFRG